MGCDCQRLTRVNSGDRAWDSDQCLQGVRVLVVDDEEALRNLFCLMLESGGCKAGGASGGYEALEKLRGHGHEVDAVILDLTMPDMNGVQVYQAMQDLSWQGPVLFLSGSPKYETLRQYPHLYGLPYVEKPCSRKELLAALEGALQGR
jgi:two-component system cell cycle sensor histidine kinase/response regulator CckA